MIYVITVHDPTLDPECEDMMMGYLPLRLIPNDSVLWHAIKEGLLEIDGTGLSGIHYEYEYAVEHRKLEAQWRVGDRVVMHKLEVQ